MGTIGIVLAMMPVSGCADRPPATTPGGVSPDATAAAELGLGVGRQRLRVLCHEREALETALGTETTEVALPGATDPIREAFGRTLPAGASVVVRMRRSQRVPNAVDLIARGTAADGMRTLETAVACS